MVRYEIKSFVMDCGEYKGLECTAPCSICSVLHKHGLVGDPAVLTNALDALGYLSRPCVFTSEFDVSALAMSMKNVRLRFHGIDTLCRIELNGRELALTRNMHRIYEFDIKTMVDVGKNTLRLYFTPTPDPDPCLRKAYATFGTDTSARLPDMGIFRKIELVAFDHKVISAVKVRQTHREGSVRLDFSLETLGYDNLSRAVATLTSPAGNVYFCGFMNGEGSITVSDPNLWWPHGMGMQNLYKLNVNLYSENEIEDTYETRIGLRRVSTATDEVTGVTQLLVNGEAMFPMGAEYVMQDIVASAESEARAVSLLRSAKEANFNTVFIHGSGVYPEKYFFDACDELGLAVWHAVPLSDSDCTDAPELCEEITHEIGENILRMANHPSLCVVYGSPRLSRMLDTEQKRDALTASFSLYDGMNVFDPSGELKSQIKQISYPSIPTYKSVCRFTATDKRNIGSGVFELHGANEDTVLDMLRTAYTRYPYANGMTELSYVLGMSAAEQSREGVEQARAAKDAILGICVGRLNDSWPTVSSSGIDYYGERKPLHYYEHRFLAPVTVMAQQRGTRVKFIVSNTSRTDYHGIFAYSIMDNRNRPVFRDSFPIRSRASSNMEVHSLDFGSVITGHEDEYYLLYSVTDNTAEASKGTYLFTKTKRFHFLKPTFTTELLGNGTEYTLTLSSDCFAKGVEISFGDTDALLSDNYFDVTGRAPVRVRIVTSRIITVEKLKRLMRIRSVYDLGHEE